MFKNNINRKNITVITLLAITYIDDFMQIFTCKDVWYIILIRWTIFLVPGVSGLDENYLQHIF